ncbi:LysR family transcriptional regulator [Xenorhabdus sp. PB30.3]|uniref:LysR family transcriptional regulator n=1 Tax=Xenorhabdus sp. PB30.3 TaxID=2788941 RepID=UPI001E63E34F|nr:LysR family transcriptional regulator [Xenorhabdus sp. PB30.3]MCC8381977.1 LysR family transcriptional regulator [Xenorhabdus sp. PB30.3]
MQSLIWDDIRVFLAVAQTGTISNAATLLGVGIATVSRKIERLEATFGMPLFFRHQTGYQLTEDGRGLLEKAEAMETAANSFLTEVDVRTKIAGKVRLATTEMLASNLIIPNLSVLQKKYPDLALEIITDSRTVNLHRRDADLALRLVRPEQGHVTVRQIGILGFGLYASKQYWENYPSQISDEAYSHAHFIGWTDESQQLPMYKWMEKTLNGRPLSIATTSLSAQVAAVKAGLGLAVLPHFIADSADLICLSPKLGLDQPLWLVIHADLAYSLKIRKVVDFITEVVSQHLQQLSSQIIKS